MNIHVFFDTFCYRERKPKTPEGEDAKVYIFKHHDTRHCRHFHRQPDIQKCRHLHRQPDMQKCRHLYRQPDMQKCRHSNMQNVEMKER